MTTVLVAADGAWVRNLVRTSVGSHETQIIECTRGQDVRDVVAEQKPDIVVLDMQIGNMGGIAVALDLHLEAGAGRAPDVPIILLLDRKADYFLAVRANVDVVLLKPVDPSTLHKTVMELISENAEMVSEVVDS